MAKWRYFADRVFPIVVRELGIPCAEPVLVTGMTRCPRHQRPLGPTTRMCLACHDQAWDEVARRYREENRPANPTERGTTMNTDTSTELVTLDPDDTMPARPPVTLFGSDPYLALERMTDLAKVLVDVVRSQKLAVKINNREHLTAEAWTTLGSLVGVVPVVCWVHPNETEDGYIARVEARTLDGRVVGAAESECSRAESRWKTRDSFQLRSMAQTRAIGRALRAPLGMITVLAGYEPTPSEDMPVVEGTANPAENDEPAGPLPQQAQPTPDQKRELTELVARLEELDPDTDWPARCRELAGVPGNKLSRGTAGYLIDKLEAELRKLEDTDA